MTLPGAETINGGAIGVDILRPEPLVYPVPLTSTYEAASPLLEEADEETSLTPFERGGLRPFAYPLV